MALKTGYKVNGKEIILDNYSKYSDDETVREIVQGRFCKTLDNYYKGQYKINYADGETEETNKIKASFYVKDIYGVSDPGQIAAELPGDNYYKTPSGIEVPKFALYGTNTVGGWINSKESTYWARFNGNTSTSTYRVITVCFDGTHLSVRENAKEEVLRTYELDDGTPLDLEVIKIWCYAVGNGGGGSSYKDLIGPKGGSGGGGASAIMCFNLYKGDNIDVRIPGAVLPDSGGNNTTIAYYIGVTKKTIVVNGGAAGSEDGGGKGGASTSYSTDTRLKYYRCKKGGDGTYNKMGDWTTTFTDYADYLPIYKYVSNPSYTKDTDPNPLGDNYLILNHSGGGASGFPGGRGGYVFEAKRSGAISEVGPGPGGGGCNVYYGENGTTYGGDGSPGAFWLLYA